MGSVNLCFGNNFPQLGSRSGKFPAPFVCPDAPHYCFLRFFQFAARLRWATCSQTTEYSIGCRDPLLGQLQVLNFFCQLSDFSSRMYLRGFNTFDLGFRAINSLQKFISHYGVNLGFSNCRS
jgi:hypothetical protein